MLTLGSLAFASPWLLVGLAALPVIWWLLRVTPPAPRRVPFPAIALLLGLRPREETPARTPFWLILLRMLLAALVIVALAHPVLNPKAPLAASGPVVLVVDDGWAAARDWSARQAALDTVLSEAERERRQIVLLTTAPDPAGVPPPLAPMRPADARAAVRVLVPKPWPVDRKAALARLERLSLPHGIAAVWLSDGVEDGGEKALASYLADRGSLRYLAADAADAPQLLAADQLQAKSLGVVVRSLPAPLPRQVEVRASGADGRLLTREAATLEPGADRVLVRLPMPAELRNRVTRVAIEGDQSAGAVLLVDERWRRRPVGIVAPQTARDQPLLSPDYYLERALAPFAEIRRGAASVLLKRQLAVLVYADSGPNSVPEEESVRNWVKGGGLLLRFAGPLLAEQGDRLLPVRLRRGGRTIGGALSWERPARLAPFAAGSPFAGLPIPADVTVSRQVLAEPDIDLAAKTWARLADGTPLVTAKKLGRGWLVLVHTTADPQWSNLALSGLFVQMLRRIVAVSQGISEAAAGSLRPYETLDGFGSLQKPPFTARPVSATALAATAASPQHPPGFYGTADSRRALNLADGIGELRPIAALPPGTLRETLGQRSAELDIRPPLLTAALILLLVDLLIALLLRGLLRRRLARIAAGILFALTLVPVAARADDMFAIRATEQLHLAYVETGVPRVDATSRAGLVGLSEMLNRRTAVDPAAPMAIDIERDDLVFFPLLYWPVTAEQAPPSPEACARINRYLETGGTILFDTRDAGEETPAVFGNPTLAEEALRRLVEGIKIPPLVPIPPGHVLTKSFYLMQDFPGRWANGQLWVEPAQDHINDGVSSVIVGSNDYAGAWAVDDDGNPLFPTVPGGERQREMAFRFGINLVMYVLTGNYKNDQVHVPAILERLGQ